MAEENARSHTVVKDISENDSKVLIGDSPPPQPVAATVAATTAAATTTTTTTITSTTQANSVMSSCLQTHNLG